MSNEIKTKLPRHLLRTFWGGIHRGVCIQITCSDPMTGTGNPDEEGFVQLTMEDAAELSGHLAEFVKAEAVRRQSLLREELARLQADDKSVFQEISKLSPELFDVPRLSVELVSKLCPKTTKTL